MVGKGEVLSNEFQVCLKIFELNENGEKAWFSRLVKMMKGDLSQATISKCIDRLYDRGMVDAEWEEIDGRWTRTLRINEDFIGFVRGLYEVTDCCED